MEAGYGTFENRQFIQIEFFVAHKSISQLGLGCVETLVRMVNYTGIERLVIIRAVYLILVGSDI
jgi:hypothetical protein